MATAIRDVTRSTDAAMRPALTPEVVSADRESAYILWATVAHQNAADVARTLGIPEPTVRSWCQRDGWRSRLQLEHQEQSQRVRVVVDTALLRIIPATVERLHQIAMGRGDIRPVLTKDGEVVELEQLVPYPAQVHAAKELLALYHGAKIHHHHHTTDTTAPASTTPAPTTHDTTATPTTPLTREAAAAMSPEERAAWERAHRQRS
ncbi:MAG: hypothetical protein M3Q71_16035 [Chloroflexota bacterium]|nr:hypothetical protein [Chloroflexota bacterium]